VIYASSLITRTVWLCRQFGPRFLYSYVMYLMRSCDQYLTNHIVTENLNDYKRYNKSVKGKCQLLSFPIFFEGVICIRDVEKIVRMFKKSVLLVKDGTAQVLKNTRNSFNKG